MSFRDYLHEKAEESRHNESVAYLMFLAGTMFFVGGMLETISLAGVIMDKKPDWFLFIPYYTEAHPSAVLSLVMIITGFSLMIFGVVSGMFYSRDRQWYMRELRKANSLEETLLQSGSRKSASNKNKRKNKA